MTQREQDCRRKKAIDMMKQNKMKNLYDTLIYIFALSFCLLFWLFNSGGK